MAFVEKRRRARKGGKSSVVWRVRYTDPDGHERSKTLPTKERADSFADEVETKKRRGEYRDPQLGREKLSVFYNQRWRPSAEHTLSPSTLELMALVWRLYVRPALGKRSLSSITPMDVRTLVTKTAKEASVYQAETALRLVRTLLRAAVDDELLTHSVAERVKPPKRPPHENRYLTHEELGQLDAEVPKRWKAFVLLAAYSGMRFGELAGLRRPHINFFRRLVRVEEAIIEVKGHHHRVPPKSGKGRVITLPAFVIEALAEHIRQWPPGPDGLIFTDVRGGPIRRRSFYRVWHRVVRAACLSPLRFHDLRHTSAALAIAEGAHPKTIQMRLGHHSAAFTLDVYGGLFEGLDSELADRLDERVRGAKSRGTKSKRRRRGPRNER